MAGFYSCEWLFYWVLEDEIEIPEFTVNRSAVGDRLETLVVDTHKGETITPGGELSQIGESPETQEVLLLKNLRFALILNIHAAEVVAAFRRPVFALDPPAGGDFDVITLKGPGVLLSLLYRRYLIPGTGTMDNLEPAGTQRLSQTVEVSDDLLIFEQIADTVNRVDRGIKAWPAAEINHLADYRLS